MKSIEKGIVNGWDLRHVYIEDLRSYLNIDFHPGYGGHDCMGMYCGNYNPWGSSHVLYLNGKPLDVIAIPEGMTYLAVGPLISAEFSELYIPAGMEMIEPNGLCGPNLKIWWYGDHPTFDLMNAIGEDSVLLELNVPESTEKNWVDAYEVEDYQPQYEGDEVDGKYDEPCTFDPRTSLSQM